MGVIRAMRLGTNFLAPIDDAIKVDALLSLFLWRFIMLSQSRSMSNGHSQPVSSIDRRYGHLRRAHGGADQYGAACVGADCGHDVHIWASCSWGHLDMDDHRRTRKVARAIIGPATGSARLDREHP